MFSSSVDFSKVCDRHSSPIFITDAKTLTLVYTNAAACDFLGKPSEDVVGRDLEEFIPIAVSAVNYDELIEGNSQSHVFEHRGHNGVLRSVRSTLFCTFDDSNAPKHIIRICEDVTELTEIDKALQEAGTLAQFGYWFLDVGSNYLYWSDEIYHIFGIEKTSFGANYEAFMDAIHPEDREAVNTAYTDSLAGNSDYDIEHRIIRRDNGEVRWVHEKCQHTLDENGQVLRSNGTVQDITERKRAEDAVLLAEQERAASTAKSQFLANMSHELRTPMNGVLGVLELLEKTQLDSRQRDMVEMIQESADGLLRILSDILDISKIESGQLELEIIEFDLYDAMKGVVQSLKPLAGQSDVTLDLKILDAPDFVTGDPLRVRQIMTNLIGNAIKFSAPHHGRSAAGLVRVTVESTPDCMVRLSVQDNGIGMSEEVLDTLFHRFVQAEQSTTRRFGGSGLGLAIVCELLGLMDGKIKVTSTLGKGSEFVVDLPLKRISEPANPVPVSGAVELLQDDFTDTFKDRKVLLVEDNKTNQLVIGAQLDSLNLKYDVVNDGAEGLEAWETGDYHLVLTDCHMPIMDGYELANSIRKREDASGLPPTPILAISAGVLKGDAEKSLAAGMNDFLPKPTKLDDLRKMLGKWL